VAENDSYPAALAENIGFLLARAHLAARDKADTALAALGLNAKAFAALATVTSSGPISQQKLSRRLGMDPATMVDVIDSLEESGQIARVRNPRDRREYSLQLTAKGKRAYMRAQQAVAEAEDEALGDLNSGDRQQLVKLLRRIAGSGAGASTAYDVIRRR
jgi:DNA-binding MarR family transcriptional regulator